MVDIVEGSAGSIPERPRWGFLAMDGTVLFAAYEALPGNDIIWKSNGSEEGTTPLFEPPTFDRSLHPRNFTRVNDIGFFVSSGGLHRTDGTEAGTFKLKGVGGWSRKFAKIGDMLYFNVGNGAADELWKSDGTKEGTTIVQGGFVGIDELTDVNGTLFFMAGDGPYTQENFAVWKSDGTAEGTVMVKDVFPDNGGGWPENRPRQLTNVNGTLFFVSEDSETKQSVIWKSDGTTDGTVMVKRENGNPFHALYLWSALDSLFFDAGGLWIINEVESLQPRLVKSVGAFAHVAESNDFIFFRAMSSEGDAELWKSDGTTANTTLVKDINSSGHSWPEQITDVNGTIFFTADDGVHGRELWKSDGTSGGTFMVEDIRPGPEGSNPSDLTHSGGRLFFNADDGRHGRELWWTTDVLSPKLQDPLPGDVDRNGTIDTHDLLALLAANKFGKGTTGATWEEGDFDDDGDFDTADLVLVLQATKGQFPYEYSSIPPQVAATLEEEVDVDFLSQEPLDIATNLAWQRRMR